MKNANRKPRAKLVVVSSVLLSLSPCLQSTFAYSLPRPGGFLGRVLPIAGACGGVPPRSSPPQWQLDSTANNGEGNLSEDISTPQVEFVPPSFIKSSEEAKDLKSTLLNDFMFQRLPDADLDKLVLAFEKVEYEANSTVIQQDLEADCFYVLSKGSCAVTINGEQLPEPYGTFLEGTVFGDRELVEGKNREATVSTKTDCTIYRVDRQTFLHFLGGRQAQEDTRELSERSNEEISDEVKTIDAAIDIVAGVITRYNGSIIQPFNPNRRWLWRQWKGTVLQHSFKPVFFNVAITTIMALYFRCLPDRTWGFGMAPDKSHRIIGRMVAFGKQWHYLMSITTFILTFFLNQSYGLWREVYDAARTMQGRFNDFNLILATSAKRRDDGQYTAKAESALKELGFMMRLCHTFMWASMTPRFAVLLTPQGMSRMLSRGLMTRAQYDVLQGLDPNVGPPNACMEWITIKALRGMKEGAFEDDPSLRKLFLEKMCILRGTYAGVGDIMDGRMPLAYAHFVQILVDSFLFMAPVALYAELGIWSILSVGTMTLFYSGLLDLSKKFLDPLDCDSFCRESVNMDIGVLIREGNVGSMRWMNGAAVLPF